MEINSPCLNCENRKIGCHNPEICHDWANYMERKKVFDKEESDRKNKKAISVNYIFNSKYKYIKKGIKFFALKSDNRYK